MKSYRLDRCYLENSNCNYLIGAHRVNGQAVASESKCYFSPEMLAVILITGDTTEIRPLANLGGDGTMSIKMFPELRESIYYTDLYKAENNLMPKKNKVGRPKKNVEATK